MGWRTYDDWKLDSPPEYKPRPGDPSCDICGEQFPEENSEEYLSDGICENCGPNTCDSCSERLTEEDSIPWKDGKYLCDECYKIEVEDAALMAGVNRFDICEGYYLYAMEYHGGQGSNEYKIFGKLHKIGFVPSPLLSNRSHLSEGGKVVYDNLVTVGYKGGRNE